MLRNLVLAWARRFTLCLPFCSAIFLSGCINISSFETAEVLAEGQHRYHFGFSDYSGTTISADVKDKRRQIWPNVELGYHHGLGEQWEWSMNLTLVGTIETSIKKQLIKSDTFNLALGSNVSYIYYRAENAKFFNLYNYHLPIFLSYRLNTLFNFYANPQYVSRWFLSEESSLRSDWLGLTLGSLFRDRFALEASYLRSTKGLDSFQVGAAFFFN